MSISLSAIEPVFAALTAIGRVRPHNEDAVLCCPRFGLWDPAALRVGGVASDLAVPPTAG